MPEYVKNMYASVRCYDPDKDVLMPVYTSVTLMRHSPFLTPRGVHPDRKRLFHWRGQMLPHFPKYSLGIRHQVLGA